jgi:hypothetical protein
MTERLKYAVICTRDREQDFADALAAIRPQVDAVIVIAHMFPDYVDDCRDWADGGVIDYSEDPPNISRMWNLGLEAVAKLADGQPYDVAVLNDDAIVPPDWFETITSAMRQVGAAAGSADQHGRLRAGDWDLDVTVGPKNLFNRLAGFAFILDGDKGLSLDEQFQWHYGDDDLEWVACGRGGVVLVGGCKVDHLLPNSTTVGVLAEIAGGDRERFRAKWGQVPHGV